MFDFFKRARYYLVLGAAALFMLAYSGWIAGFALLKTAELTSTKLFLLLFIFYSFVFALPLAFMIQGVRHWSEQVLHYVPAPPEVQLLRGLHIFIFSLAALCALTWLILRLSNPAAVLLQPGSLAQHWFHLVGRFFVLTYPYTLGYGLYTLFWDH